MPTNHTATIAEHLYTTITAASLLLQHLNMAACCLAFLWISTSKSVHHPPPSDTQYDKDCHLSIDDNSIDNLQLLKVTIKQAKTDPFRVGEDLYLGATGTTICPVKGLLPYLTQCDHHKRPLFILEAGKYLTCQRLCSLLDGLPTKLQIDISKYNTYNFCIGAATTAKQANFR